MNHFLEYCIIHLVVVSAYILFALLCILSIQEGDTRKTLQYFIVANLAGIFLFQNSQVILISGLIIVSVAYPSKKKKQGVKEPTQKLAIKRTVQVKRRTPIRKRKGLTNPPVDSLVEEGINIDNLANITPTQTVFKALAKVSSTKLF